MDSWDVEKDFLKWLDKKYPAVYADLWKEFKDELAAAAKKNNTLAVHPVVLLKKRK